MFWRMIGLCIFMGLAILYFYKTKDIGPGQPDKAAIGSMANDALKIRKNQDEALEKAMKGM